MRMFLAIELPDSARAHLVDVQRRLGAEIAKASWTKPENLHLTLKFLGEVDAKRSDALVESLSRIGVDGAIELRAEHVVCFPPRGPVRIIAAALGGTVAPLQALHQAIEQRCAFLGFEREGRAYTPHVTLGRARPTLPPATRERAAAVTEGMWPGPRFAVGEFVLMESRLKPTGAEYHVAARFAVGATSR
jgi:RNA 2',3'-cyclic 3'-phosphodiesterase